MANLPNKPFLFNYNSLQYNAETRTLPKTKGQLIDKDIVIPSNLTVETYDTGEILINGGFTLFEFPTVDDNPCNRDAENTTFTFICKSVGDVFKIANGSAVNTANYYYNASGSFQCGGRYYLRATNWWRDSTQIQYIRVNADGSAVRKNNKGRTSTASKIEWGAKSNQVILKDSNVILWFYCSNEALTDEEIQQVIDYNENPSSFSTTPDTLDFNYNGTAQTLAIESENSWTATTIPSWISLSQSEGTTAATITVSASKNTSSLPRTGTLIFENGDGDTAEVSVSQEKYPLIVPINNMIFGGE